MTRIEFYFNVANKHELIENLVQSALLKRRKIAILTLDEQESAAVSEYLWQNNSTHFLPNMIISHAQANQIDSSQNDSKLTDLSLTDLNQKALIKAAVTPVVISTQIKTLLQDDLLINLTTNEPIFFSRFTQLIEIIGLSDEDKRAGRQRYKFYRDRGYEIKNIDYAKPMLA